MLKTKTLAGWITGAELGRRIGVSGGAVSKYAVRVGIRRILRKGLPPLYNEADVMAIVADIQIEGDGIAPGATESVAS